MEQRICIKFCYKNGIKCSTVVEMLNVAFGESSMNKTSVYKWYKRFKEGREDIEDDERLGRPSSSATDENVEKIKKMIMDNRRVTIREVADDIGISFGSCQSIFTNVLGMRKSSTPSLKNKCIPLLKSKESVSNILPVTKEVQVSNQCRTTENIPTQSEEESPQIESSPNEEDISLKRKRLENIPLAADNKLIFSVMWGKKLTKKHISWESVGTLEINGKNGILKNVGGQILARTNSIKTALESGTILTVGDKEVQLIDEIQLSGGTKQNCPELKNENSPKRARTEFMRKDILIN